MQEYIIDTIKAHTSGTRSAPKIVHDMQNVSSTQNIVNVLIAKLIIVAMITTKSRRILH